MNSFELIPKEYQDEARKNYNKQLNSKARKIVSYEMPCIGKNKNIDKSHRRIREKYH